MWVASMLCSSCIPYDIDYKCRDCGHEFPVTVEEDASIVVDGEEYEYSLLISARAAILTIRWIQSLRRRFRVEGRRHRS